MAERETAAAWWGAAHRGREWAPLTALLLVSAILGTLSPHFRTTDNLLTVLLQTAVVMILGIGETLVIIAGGIDLSVGSVLGLSGVTTALIMSGGGDPWVAAAAGIGAGAAVGLVNGVLSAYARMPSFIVTLGTMGMARGLALILTGGNNVSGLPREFRALGGGVWAGIPIPVLLSLAAALVTHIVLSRTRFGRYCYATGSNAEAARLSGVPVARGLTLVFVLSGALSGFAGVIQTSRLMIGQPTTGEGFELEAVAAAVIGGASLSGGEGSVAGTLLGSLLLSVLRNGGHILGRQPFEMDFLIGAVVILAVLYDTLRRRR